VQEMTNITLIIFLALIIVCLAHGVHKPCYCTVSELAYLPNLSSDDALAHTRVHPHIMVVPDHVATIYPYRVRAQQLLRTVGDDACPCSNSWTKLEGIHQNTHYPSSRSSLQTVHHATLPPSLINTEPALCATSGRLPSPLSLALPPHRRSSWCGQSTHTTATSSPPVALSPARGERDHNPRSRNSRRDNRSGSCPSERSSGYTIAGCTVRPPGAHKTLLRSGAERHGVGAEEVPRVRVPDSVTQRDADMAAVSQFRVRLNVVSTVLAVLRVLTWVMR